MGVAPSFFLFAALAKARSSDENGKDPPHGRVAHGAGRGCSWRAEDFPSPSPSPTAAPATAAAAADFADAAADLSRLLSLAG